MLNYNGKLRGDTPPNRMRIVQTAGSVEPDDMAITQAWPPSSTYQQLLTVWWDPHISAPVSAIAENSRSNTQVDSFIGMPSVLASRTSTLSGSPSSGLLEDILLPAQETIT